MIGVNCLVWRWKERDCLTAFWGSELEIEMIVSVSESKKVGVGADLSSLG